MEHNIKHRSIPLLTIWHENYYLPNISFSGSDFDYKQWFEAPPRTMSVVNSLFFETAADTFMSER